MNVFHNITRRKQLETNAIELHAKLNKPIRIKHIFVLLSKYSKIYYSNASQPMYSSSSMANDYPTPI